MHVERYDLRNIPEKFGRNGDSLLQLYLVRNTINQISKEVSTELFN